MQTNIVQNNVLLFCKYCANIVQMLFKSWFVLVLMFSEKSLLKKINILLWVCELFQLSWISLTLFNFHRCTKAAAEIVETLICTTCISTCLALSCWPRYPLRVACLSHLLHLSEKLPCLSSSSMISLTLLFQSFSFFTSHSCPSWQLLPHNTRPRVPDSTHMT